MKADRLQIEWTVKGQMPLRAQLVALVLVGLSLAMMARPAKADASPVTVEAKAIDRFRKGSDETRFKDLIYVGGFSFAGSDSRLKGVSGFRAVDGGERFLEAYGPELLAERGCPEAEDGEVEAGFAERARFHHWSF